MSDPEVLRREVVYEAPIFTVVRQLLRAEDGSEFERTTVEHGGSVAMVAIDEQGRWLLVRQFRLPAKSALLEIPAGTREAGEPPEETAARELREETGYAASSIEHIGAAWIAPGFLNEYMHFYLATGLREDPLPGDEHEGISEVQALTHEELLDAIGDGRVQDAKTIAAVTLYERHRSRSRERG